jgi:peroxiredoxin
MRAFLFIIWVHSHKQVSHMITNLENLGKANYEIVSQNGRQVVSASVQGKQFTYNIPDGYSVADFQEQLREAYSLILTGGASGGQMTDAEISNYVIDKDKEITNVARARFSNNKNSNYYYGY